ncbi:ABC transporter permease [Microbacterium immunditiarum]|uniref:Multidrug/hemolysin transport system permease protein n=1 Tax=Microbacterium immunditiarum TaxID=337480 RepID=A0A7Y9GQU5_9MICO|nr:multidrug/hemolysin transport system permease protein [Microbacterium immunditiarum]
MNTVLSLVGRNLRIFFRDRANVFFSLLGALILFGLYVLFLGNVQTQGVAQSLPGVATEDVQAFVDSWMFAGIVLITTITTGLGSMAALVDDGESGRFRDFLVAPIRRGQLVLGYLVSAATVSLIMSLAVLVVSVLYLGILRGVWLDPAAILGSVGVVVLCCLAFTALNSFIVSFVGTAGAFAALSTIMGTLLGFIAAAYLPIGLLPAVVGNLLNSLPIAQAGVLLRRQFTAETLPAVTGGHPEADEFLRHYFGIDAIVEDWTVPTALIIGILVAMIVAFAALSALRIRARIR